MNHFHELRDMSAEIQANVEDVCEDFETAWQRGEQPDITRALDRLTGPARALLLRELIAIERHYRSRGLGREVTAAELLDQHPSLREELSHELLADSSKKTQVDGETQSCAAPADFRKTVDVAGIHFGELPVNFGRYRLLRRLGAGGMGSVYLAEDTQLERRVALKLPQIEAQSDPQMINRFYREAKAAATLRHANLCSVYDVGEVDGVHFLTMEYIEGQSLADRMKERKRFDEREIVRLVKKIALALHEAHRNGVVHRDLKPANIMIDQQGEPTITDFGLARRQQSDENSTQITHHGQIVGTPAYMSPEQVDGDIDRVGPASDVYALGVVFFELLTGRRPFQGSTAAILGQILSADPPPMSQLRNAIDPELEAFCRKMLARRLEDRYQSMEAVAAAAQNWLEADTSDQPPRGATRQRRQLVTILGGLGATTVLLWAGTYFFSAPPGGVRVPDTAVPVNPATTTNISVEPTRKSSNPLADERQVAEWVIDHGGNVDVLVVGGRALGRFDKKSSLPAQPFYLTQIYELRLAEDEGDQLQQINRLRGLLVLGFAQDGCPSGALRGIRLGRNFRELRIPRTLLRTADVLACEGLERITELYVSGDQVDDGWEFLKRMPRLRLLGIEGNASKRLAELAEADAFRDSFVRRISVGVFPKVSDAVARRLQDVNPKLTINEFSAKGVKPLGARVQESAIKRLLELGFEFMIGISGGAEVRVSAAEKLGDENIANVIQIKFPRGFQITAESIELIDQLSPGFFIVADSVTQAWRLVDHFSVRRPKILQLTNSDLTEADFARLLQHFQQGHLAIHGTRISKERIQELKQGYPLIQLETDFGTFPVSMETSAASVVEDESPRSNGKPKSIPHTPLPDGPPGEVAKLSGHRDLVRDVAFSPDGRLVASVSWDRSIRLWDVEHQREVHQFELQQRADCVVFSVDGQWIAGRDWTGIKIWETKTGRIVQSKQARVGNVKSMAFRPMGHELATGSNDGNIDVWDLTSGEIKHRFSRGPNVVIDVIYSRDGQRLYGATLGRPGVPAQLSLWDAQSYEELWTIHPQQQVDGFQLSPDETVVAYSGWNALFTIDLPIPTEVPATDSLNLVTRCKLNQEGKALAFHPDGRHVICGCNDQAIRIVDLAERKVVYQFDADAHVTAHVAISPDGRFLISGGDRYGNEEMTDFEDDGDYSLRVWRMPQFGDLKTMGQDE